MKNNLKYFRLIHGYTQSELAELAECSRNTISSIERDEFLPSLRLAFKLSDVLNVKIQSLFDFSDECRIFNVDILYRILDLHNFD